MTKTRQYKVFVSFFPYGGNGGAPTEHPSIRDWFTRSVVKLLKHPLVGEGNVQWQNFSDTPITMTRNQAVLRAREARADILVMVDSDMWPDMYVAPSPWAKSRHALQAKPFLDVAIDVIDQWYERGPIVIGAPYCGPPPEENPYVFTWEEWPSEGASKSTKLRQMTRKEAHDATGITSVAALPTGLIAYDMRIFDYAEPTEKDGKGWFYYAWENEYAANKQGTEDVMATRDLSMGVILKHGYNPLKCAWDCWAGHVKPWVVGKPTPVCAEQIEERFRTAVLEGAHSVDRVLDTSEIQPRI